jgi:hypothetical protein
MAKLLRDSKAVGKAVLMTVIVVVLAICVTVGFVIYEFRPQESTTLPTINPTPTVDPTETSLSPTPTQTDTDTGTLQFRTKDAVGNILIGTVVSSTNQPNGVVPLYGVTNSTGYVTFGNLPAGTYSFSVTKEGFREMNETINFNGATLSLTLTLSTNEKITIQAVSYDSTSRVLTIYAQSQTTDASPALKGITVKDASGNTVANLGIGTITPVTTGNTLASGTLYIIQSTVNPNGLNIGAFTATLVTVAGNSFVSPSFTATSQAPYYN